jgi:hypothetical protein
MRRIATPGELARWREHLASLSEDRQVAVIRMISEVAADCHYCEGPVRRCDSRGSVRDRLVHLHCVPARHLTLVQRDALADLEAQR